MGTKPRRIAEKVAAKIGVEECRFTSATFSNSMFEIKESKLLTVLTFGRIMGLAFEVWMENDRSFTVSKHDNSRARECG